MCRVPSESTEEGSHQEPGRRLNQGWVSKLPAGGDRYHSFKQEREEGKKRKGALSRGREGEEGREKEHLNASITKPTEEIGRNK